MRKMKEAVFIALLFALVLLGFYCMNHIDRFLQENYRREWQNPEETAEPLYLPRRYTTELPSLLRYGTILLRKDTLTDEVRPSHRDMH